MYIEGGFEALRVAFDIEKRFVAALIVDDVIDFKSIRYVITFMNVTARLNALCFIIIDDFDVELQRVSLQKMRRQNQKLIKT